MLQKMTLSAMKLYKYVLLCKIHVLAKNKVKHTALKNDYSQASIKIVVLTRYNCNANSILENINRRATRRIFNDYNYWYCVSRMPE